MQHRLRHAVLLGVVAATAAATPASAYVTSDLVNFNLTESYSTWPSQYSIATGTDGVVQYRWLDSPSKPTLAFSASCVDLSNLGAGPTSYGSGDTSYRTTFAGYTGECFYMRARVATGYGSMTNYDGRVKR